ncbi:hypothetical protein ACWGJB_40260 [Streptomyces sp. NPDC054813]
MESSDEAVVDVYGQDALGLSTRTDDQSGVSVGLHRLQFAGGFRVPPLVDDYRLSMR